jgi:hypothetical protein
VASMPPAIHPAAIGVHGFFFFGALIVVIDLSTTFLLLAVGMQAADKREPPTIVIKELPFLLPRKQQGHTSDIKNMIWVDDPVE